MYQGYKTFCSFFSCFFFVFRVFLHQHLEWRSTIKHNGISSLMFGVRQRRISTVDRQIISPLVMFHSKSRHGLHVF